MKRITCGFRGHRWGEVLPEVYLNFMEVRVQLQICTSCLKTRQVEAKVAAVPALPPGLRLAHNNTGVVRHLRAVSPQDAFYRGRYLGQVGTACGLSACLLGQNHDGICQDF